MAIPCPASHRGSTQMSGPRSFSQQPDAEKRRIEETPPCARCPHRNDPLSWSAIATCAGTGSISARSTSSRVAQHWPVIVEEEPVFDDRPPGLDVLQVAAGRDRPPAPPPARSGPRPRAAGRGLCRAGAGAAGPWSAGSTRPMFAPYGDRLGAGPGGRLRLHGRAGQLRRCPGRAGRGRGPACWSGPTSSSPAAAACTSRRRDRNPNVHCFPSAVESDALRPRPRPRPARARRPGRVCPGPIFGYYGVVDERLDYDLIARLADAAGGRLGRPGRADDQGRSRRAPPAAQPALPRPAGRTPSCPAT